MTIIAGTLIRESLLLASVKDAGEHIEGEYATTGINFLNDILTQKGALNPYVPYTNILTVPIVQNVTQYTIPQVIIQILEANLNTTDGGLMSVLRIADFKDYNLFDQTVVSRPSYVFLHTEQIVINPTTNQLGSLLKVYPVPSQSYNMNLLLKYQLQVKTIDQKLTEFNPAYIMPLKFQLARYFSNLYKTKLPPDFYAQYKELMDELKATNASDMTILSENPFLDRQNFKKYRFYYGYQ